MQSVRPLTVVTAVVCSVLLTGAEVTFYEEAKPISLNPLFANSMPEIRTNELTHDRLTYRSAITYEPRSRLVDLASMSTSDDGRTLTLPLRADIRWHDGKMLSPSDICFTIRAMQKPTNAVSERVRKAAADITGCQADDRAHSVSITLRKAFFNPLDRLSFAILPEHGFASDSILPTADYSLRPTGTGPTKASAGPRAVSLSAFPNAHQNAGIPLIKQLPMPDPFSAVSTLTLGSAHGIISVTPPLRPQVQASDQMALKSYDVRSWWFVALNTNKGSLADPRVRQALNLSIDREELRKLTVGAQAKDPNPPAEFISGPFVGSSPFYNRAIEPVAKSDLAKASGLMNQAGATQHFGKWIVDNKPITLKIGMNSALDAEAVDLLNQMGNQLAAAGFDRVVHEISEDEWRRLAITGQLKDYDMLVGKWSFGVVEDVEPMFHTRKSGKGTLNLFDYSNPDTDQLFATAEAARTDTELRDAYHDLHAHLAQDLPYLYLWKLDTKSAWRNEVRGNVITPYYYFTEYEGWRFDG